MPIRTIGFEIKLLNNLIKRSFDERIVNSGLESVTGAQGLIICYLSENDDKKDIFQKDIEAEFNIRRSTATGILQLMEKNGLIEKVSVSQDARLKKLVLTQKSVELNIVINKNIMEFDNKLTNGLSEEEKNTLYIIMNKIKNNIK